MVFYKIRDCIVERRLARIMDRWNRGEDLTQRDKERFYFGKGLAVRQKIMDSWGFMGNQKLSDRYSRKMETALLNFANLFRERKGLPQIDSLAA